MGRKWRQLYTEYWNPVDELNHGWHNVFFTLNGIDYQYEALFKWSGSIMGSTAKTRGDSLAVDFIINDNDGALGAEGTLSWSGLEHTNPSHWAKLKLFE